MNVYKKRLIISINPIMPIISLFLVIWGGLFITFIFSYYHYIYNILVNLKRILRMQLHRRNSTPSTIATNIFAD